MSLRRHNEDNLNEDFSQICPFPIDPATVDSPHTKTFLLLQSQMFLLPVPISDYTTDLKSALDNSMRVLQVSNAQDSSRSSLSPGLDIASQIDRFLDLYVRLAESRYVASP